MSDREAEPNAAEWRALNHAWWDERAKIHETSRFYESADEGLRDEEWIDLGSVDGLDVIHPQCHIGTDTLSLVGAGARTVGLDFSEAAIAGAGRIAADRGLDARAEWVAADVYDSVEAVGGRQFDLVYTGLGALCWLPDLDRWARVMWELCRPGGRLYLTEFHPFLEVMSDDDTDIERPYFPIGGQVFNDSGSYADRDAATTNNDLVDFVHPFSEVMQALLDVGFQLRSMREYDYTVYERWPWLEQPVPGRWVWPADRPALPFMYSLLLDRPAT